MKRKFFCMILFVIVLCSSSLCGEASALGTKDGETGTFATGSITVSFMEKDTAFYLYRAASGTGNAVAGYEAFTGEEAFQSCYMDFSDRSASALRSLATTLYGCVLRDGISPFKEAVTDETGKAVFEGLESGWYLLTAPGHAAAEVVIVEEGQQVEVEPKAQSAASQGEPAKEENTTTIEVTVTWEDGKETTNRPEYVRIQIYQDGELYDTVEVSEKDDWTYTWTELPAGHEYMIVQESSTGNYVVNVVQDGNTFTIHNIVDLDAEDAGKKETEGTRTEASETTKTETEESKTEDGTKAQTESDKKVSGKNDSESKGDGSSKTGETEDTSGSVSGITGTVTNQEKEGTSSSTTTTKTRLPQTGQLWWPVFVMAGCGLVLIALGIRKWHPDS